MLSRNINLLPAKDSAVLVVVFERTIDMDELAILRGNFHAGKIKHDPDKELERAIVAQHCLELQEAIDVTGVSGYFHVKSIEVDKQIDSNKMEKLS